MSVDPLDIYILLVLCIPTMYTSYITTVYTYSDTTPE